MFSNILRAIIIGFIETFSTWNCIIFYKNSPGLLSIRLNYYHALFYVLVQLFNNIIIISATLSATSGGQFNVFISIMWPLSIL